MKTILKGFLLLFALFLADATPTPVRGATPDDLKAFPAAEPGMVRHVLRLPKQADEDSFRVQLIVGKTVSLDPANRYHFGGKLSEETIPGWGYSRYVLKALGPMMGTRMAIDPDVPKVMRFITLAGEPQLIRYNSKLPLVIYLPEGVEVRYRIWSAGSDVKTVEKG